MTELVSGVDIVREQFHLAAGLPLSDAVRDAAARAATPAGHAIEVRISAEDPGRDFAPTPGPIRHWVMPSGPGVRVDTAIEAGDRVPPEYDNLIAKVMVHAGDRATAIDRLARALAETEIAGIQTTLPFHRFVARAHRRSRTPTLSTDWVADHWDGHGEAERAQRLARLAAALGLACARGAVPGVLAQRQPGAAATPGRRRTVVGGARSRLPSIGGRRHERPARRAAPDGAGTWLGPSDGDVRRTAPTGPGGSLARMVVQPLGDGRADVDGTAEAASLTTLGPPRARLTTAGRRPRRPPPAGSRPGAARPRASSASRS